MFRYEDLSQKPRSFRTLTGISVKEFEALFVRFEPRWHAAEQRRLRRSNRQRKLGAGRKYALETRTLLVMTLMWLHLYLSTETLGVLMGVSKSSVSRHTRRVVRVLRALGQDTVWWREPPRRGAGKSLEEVVRQDPDLLAVLDVMELTVQRPKARAAQIEHFSGKKKQHTRKVGLLVNERGLIRGVTASRPGRQHDLTVFRESGLLTHIPLRTTVVGDKAFHGLQHDLPDHNVGLPHKAGRKVPLGEAEKWANRDLSRQRVIVENTICELRHFKILADRFRHAFTWCLEVLYAVIALINPRIAARLA